MALILDGGHIAIVTPVYGGWEADTSEWLEGGRPAFLLFGLEEAPAILEGHELLIVLDTQGQEKEDRKT